MAQWLGLRMSYVSINVVGCVSGLSVAEWEAKCLKYGFRPAPGLAEVSHEDVERSLQQNKNNVVIIDVREFDEVARFGKIPSSHILPGFTVN